MDTQFTIDSPLLENLVLSLPSGVHIKDATTGKFIMGNLPLIKILGFNKTTDFVGQTIEDLDIFMRPYWGKDFAQKITAIDRYIKDNNKFAQIKNALIVSKSGFVHIQDIMKLPLSNNRNKVTAIFTYIHDKTKEINLELLFKTYQKIYPKPHEASKYFCCYLNIEKNFSELPTDTELMLLLQAKSCTTRNEISKKMCRSIKTIETHITHINNKLKIGNFFDIVNIIRSGS